MNKILLGVVGLVIVGGAAALFLRGPADDRMVPIVNVGAHGAAAAAAARPAAEIIVPEFSSAAQMGQAIFDEKCSTCHGKKGAGTENGPPLMHKIYEPSHHADFAFMRAVRSGVQSHHWRFGNMAPVAGVTDKQVEWIVTYVREMQRANGIN